jgi:hypothetical protein
MSATASSRREALSIPLTSSLQETPILESKFTCFLKLPRELRGIIWSLAIPGPRTIPIFRSESGQGRSKLEDHTDTVHHAEATLHKVPALLHTSREGRIAAEKFYVLVLKKQLGNRPIYFDNSRSTIPFENLDALCALYGLPVATSYGTQVGTEY